MTREEKTICKMYLNDLDRTHDCNEYKLLMQLLEQQPCEDCVSRAYLLDDSKYHTVFNDDTGNFEDVVYREDIEKAPSITLARKKCKWILYDYRTLVPREHGDIPNPYWRIPARYKTELKYCPYCGGEIDYFEVDAEIEKRGSEE